MRRALAWLLAVGLLLAGGWWLALLPGRVRIATGPWLIELAMPAALAALALALGLAVGLTLALAALAGLPVRLRRRRRETARARGDRAVTEALVALAAGEPGPARQAAAEARRRLGDMPQTLLLAAQAARLDGAEAEAETLFRLLSAHPDAAFVGYRGLLRLAAGRADRRETERLMDQAERVRPGAAWLRRERRGFALRADDWPAALHLSHDQPARARAALATAAARDGNGPDAMAMAQEGFEADPANPEAALALCRHLRRTGRMRRLRAVLRRAWAANPHPALADAWLEGLPDPAARLRAGRQLAGDGTEDRLLLARLALDAGQVDEARRLADSVRLAGCDQARLWRLLADIADAPAASDHAMRHEALRRAADCAADPGWRCAACGREQARWMPVCEGCGATGQVRWAADAAPAS